MKSVNDRLDPLYRRLDAMTVRERTIIAATVLVATLFVWSELVLDGQLLARREAATRVMQLRGEIATLEIEQAQLQQQINQDPNRALQARLERYEGEIERVDRLLEEQTLEFISPRQMVAVMRSMIKRESGLRLTRMESLDPVDPVVALDRASDDKAGQKNAGVGNDKTGSGAYLHALEMEFEGDYLAVIKYIRHLESLEWKFVWRSLSVEIVDYPTATVRLRLETLSQSDGWIGV